MLRDKEVFPSIIGIVTDVSTITLVLLEHGTITLGCRVASSTDPNGR
jgi:hypothetical protein